MDSDTQNQRWSPSPADGRLDGEDDSRLDDLFQAYRQVCADPEPSVNFVPELWAKIEARQSSSTLFSRVAKALVTAALGASVVMGILSASYNRPVPSYEGSYVQALAADHASSLEPLQVERLSELDQ